MTLVNSRMVRGRCPCGAEHATCGPPSTSQPVLETLEVAAVGGPLKKYTVTSASGVETVMKLNEQDARRYGLLEESEPQPAEPEAAATKPQAKKRAVSNKARSVHGKGGAGGGDD